MSTPEVRSGKMNARDMLVTSVEVFRVFLGLLYDNYRQDRLPVTAAALTYQTLFAVVPLLTITYTFVSAFEAFQGMGEKLQAFLFENIVPENVAVVEAYLKEFSDQARSLSWTSIVIVLATAFLMMFTIERAFNDIWRVQEPRHGFQRILVYSAILTWGPMLIVGGIGLTTYLLTLPVLTGVTSSAGFLSVIPVVLSGLVFSVMYLTVPNCNVPLRHGLIGGFVVAILFEVVKRSFGGVMAKTDFEVIYGTFAAVPLFLLWIYLSWTLVLFGAELTKGIGLFSSEHSKKTEPAFLQILIILRTFFECHRRGEVVSDRMLSRLSGRVDMRYWHDYKADLLKRGLIRQVDRGGLVLSKDLNEVSLWELYQQLNLALPDGFVTSSEGWEANLQERLQRLSGTSKESLDIDLESLFREGSE